MKLIAGLGNPEVKYLKTRHNIGFMVLDEVLSIKNLTLGEKFKSFFVKQGDIVYLMPKTYMNLSGIAIREAMDFFKIPIESILIVYDDLSLDIGTLRFRPQGSSGGHNGIKSIIKETNSEKFPRLKIGIGPQPKNVPSEKFVLAQFQKDEEEILNKVIKIAAAAVIDWIDLPIEKLQEKYNKSHI